MVMGWIMENAEKYGLDTDNIFMVGDSAGGHLLGLYTAMCTPLSMRQIMTSRYLRASCPEP